ncbi:hypothetical protein EC988_002312, partial [Linderina pennispora]
LLPLLPQSLLSPLSLPHLPLLPRLSPLAHRLVSTTVLAPVPAIPLLLLPLLRLPLPLADPAAVTSTSAARMARVSCSASMVPGLASSTAHRALFATRTVPPSTAAGPS